jgi:hypothetical protein
MGGMVMGKCEGKQGKYFHAQTECKHLQGGYGGLQFGYVYTCNGFLYRMCKFLKTDSKAFFHQFT